LQLQSVVVCLSVHGLFLC